MERKAVSGTMLTLLFVGMFTFAYDVQLVSAGIYPAIYIEPVTTIDPALIPGENFTISICTDYNGSDIWAYELALTYDPSILQGINVTNGDLITTAKHPSAMFTPGTFNNTEGKLSQTLAHFFYLYPNEPYVTSGPGILAYVTFTVVGTGISNITLGPRTRLIGYSAGDSFKIIDAETQPDHISHGYFDNVKPIHDVAAIGIVAPTTTVVIGQLVSNIDVIVANEGNFTETFSVITYTNASVIGTQMGITLARGRRTALTFDWDTTDLTVGNSTITAEAILAGDADLTNNHASTTVIVAPGALNPTPPGYEETSEYLIGSVAVGVILPESNGTIDPSTEDWTSIEEAQVVSEITAGLDWWAAYNPSAGVSFSVEVHYLVPTSYEPISRPGMGDEGLWISEVMTYLGYPGTGDFFMRVRDYVNDLRNQLGTDWAFAIFVVDSSNDSDGMFADGWYAYACLGGPFFVMTYDNSHTGIDGMDIITAHEMGHIFYATDEYNDVTEYSGYLYVSDSDNADCLMNFNVWKLCDATQGQIGWRDTDGDGIQDIVDTVPNTILNAPILHGSISTFRYTGSVTVSAYPNQRPWWGRRNVTINTITNVECRIDNGPWINATAPDGAFDETQEIFTFVTPSLSEGVHIVEARGTNSVGNVETSYASDIVYVPFAGDVDCDGDIDLSDLSDFGEAYGSTNDDSSCDFNSDGKVDALDLFDLSKNYGKTV